MTQIVRCIPNFKSDEEKTMTIKQICISLFLMLSALSVNAASIESFASVDASYRSIIGKNPDGSPKFAPRWQRYFSEGDGGVGKNFASAVGTAPGYRASAIAQTQYRGNHFTVSLAKTNPEYGTVGGSASSVWTDELYFTGGSGTSTVEFVFSVNGSVQGNSRVSFWFDFDYDDVFSSASVTRSFTKGFSSETVRLTGEINSRYASDPILIEAGLRYSNIIGPYDTGKETTNFSNSAILTQVITAPGITISSASGTDYMSIISPKVSTVPVPSTATLLCVSMLLGFFGFRKKMGL